MYELFEAQMFRDRAGLVTGASNGVGRAVALELARRGARMALLDVDEAGLREVCDLIRDAGGSAVEYVADLRDIDAIRAVATAVRDAVGGLDILVNVAGVTRWRDIGSTSLEDWELIHQVDNRAPFFLMQALGPMLSQSAHGSVVNVASIAGKGYRNTSAAAYAAAKAGVIALTRVASAAWAPKVRVNAVCPGPIRTDFLLEGMREKAMNSGRTADEEYAEWVEGFPLQRAAEPEDVAGLICFLASDAARCITGQSVNIDGGMVFD